MLTPKDSTTCAGGRAVCARETGRLVMPASGDCVSTHALTHLRRWIALYNRCAGNIAVRDTIAGSAEPLYRAVARIMSCASEH